MGLFDKIFGRGASEAARQQPNAQQQFNTLRQKYQPALAEADRQHVQLTGLFVQDSKLLMKGVAPSEQAKNVVWDRIKSIDPSYSDLIADIRVQPQPQQQAPAAAPAAPPSAATQPSASQQLNKEYTVQPGDTLSKISRQVYGDGDEYMRIFYANRSLLDDPDKIQVGQKLIIPPDDDL